MNKATEDTPVHDDTSPRSKTSSTLTTVIETAPNRSTVGPIGTIASRWSCLNVAFINAEVQVRSLDKLMVVMRKSAIAPQTNEQ